jgi:hypothetical protein
MRLQDWRTALGLLAALAAFALSLPGVRVARAQGEVAVISVNLVDSAPSCESGADPTAAQRVEVTLERDANPSDARARARTIALDTQGYSYREPNVDPEARALESR